MSYLKEVSKKYFDVDDDGVLSEHEAIEFDRVNALNRLPLEQFLMLPEQERRVAEELWAAQALDNGSELLRERQERVLSEMERFAADLA